MRLTQIVSFIMLGKLAAAVIKKSRETDRDIFDEIKERSDNNPQRKTGGNNESPRPTGKPEPPTASENRPNKTATQSSPPPVSESIVRPVPAKPDMDVSDNFTPYEGADMTCREADEAGFEFVGSDRYHGVDFCIGRHVDRRRNRNTEEISYIHKGLYNCAGIPGCAITGWHGSDEIVKVPRSINGRPVVKIEKRAFLGKEIREIYLPDSVIDIDDSAFFCCYSLTYARLSKNLVRIGHYAFFACKALERVYLGGVRFIDKCAFRECRKLASVRLPETVELLGYGAFAHTGLQKIYWNEIIHAEDKVLENTPYRKNNSVILLGDCLQKCSLKNVGEIIIDDPKINSIATRCFGEAIARKVTLSDNVRELKGACFYHRIYRDGRVDEIYAPGLWKFGNECFSSNQKITVSNKAKSAGYWTASEGYLYIEENSFRNTHMEKLYNGGSGENPCVCVMVRNILARVEPRSKYAVYEKVTSEILTLSEDGSTLIMDDRVESTAARHIPTLGAKKLILSNNLSTLRSFSSIEDFEEIVFQEYRIEYREKMHFRPKKSVLIRFKFDHANYGKPVDCAVLLYLPNVIKASPEAERLYALYDRCLGGYFWFDGYDREILNLVSSYRARFTISRLRLEGDFGLKPEARERYENFLITHKRKAEFTAKKHGDTALLSLLEKLTGKVDNAE